MTDLLLELAKRPKARSLIKTLGLPIPVPQPLRRARGPWTVRPLSDMDVAVYTRGDSAVAPVLARTLAEAGANPKLDGDEAAFALFAEPGEAFGRPAEPLGPPPEKPPKSAGGKKDRKRGPRRRRIQYDAMVCDATTLATPADLRQLYDFFHARIGLLRRCGRVVVIGRRCRGVATPEAAAASAALDGFVRSLAKELGRKGSTAQLVTVEAGAEPRLAGPLRFLLSERSAYVTGQPLHVDRAATGEIGPPIARPLQGKVALVTGAARGIGAQTARRLAEDGALVVCLDRPQDDGPLSRLAREIEGDVLLCDVSDDDAPDRIAAHLTERHGGVDIVVHNAGITRDKTLGRMREAQWDQTLDINLGAVIRITRRLVEGGLRDGARVVCLSSIAGIAGNVGQTNYAASKAGLLGYVRCLAPALAERGITVNAIAPGFIETRMTQAMPIGIREVARRMNNLGQGGRPEDVADAVAFMAMPDSLGITGRVLRVCGGSLVGA